MTSLRIPALALLLAAAPAWATDNGPVEIVRDTTYQLYDIVNENRERFEQEPALLEDVVRDKLLPHIDVVYSGRLVLGRAGRDLEREQIEEFAEALSEILIGRYAEALLGFQSRDQVEILPLAGENTERMTRVRTRVRLESGARAPVDYVFRKRGERWQIFDVIAEGISYVATFRNQIGEQIRREGFDSVMDRLRAGEIEIDFENEQT